MNPCMEKLHLKEGLKRSAKMIGSAAPQIGARRQYHGLTLNCIGNSRSEGLELRIGAGLPVQGR